ncbi:MAG: ribosomal protein S18-alanine N-acetyltransferase [Defluviitaleaceae bacterium]|nr:ribosomal protein S18-alanine N-acetyltransferase [Defluviitaleaceae bacterium]MCL2835767.1 ribosomal protein S18-alanine N-acetyltransferase [Defluviitaleaceae bacterium]
MLEIIPMEQHHLDAVYAVEKVSFAVPWSLQMLADDLAKPESVYYVALEDGEVVGYGGIWHVINEGHITNIAVAPHKRRRGIGAALLEKIISSAVMLEMVGIQLEVRVGNYDAQRLYMKNGFILERIRKNYYSDTGEDALVLWKRLKK